MIPDGIKILSTGRAAPETVIPNRYFESRIDTTDEWIVSRTGIHERRFCKNESNEDLACRAAEAALKYAAIDPRQIGVCIVATLTPDCATPSVACGLQRRLGLRQDIPSFDLNAACSGFLYALRVGRDMLQHCDSPYALIIGSEQLSRILNTEDRATAALFGDGAGAVIMQLAPTPFYHLQGARGDRAIWAEGPGNPVSHIHMDGQAVFQFAVTTIPNCIQTLLDQSGLALSQIDHIVCHQANERIIDLAARRMKADPQKFYKNMARYGNTSAASIPLALDEMNEQGLLLPGQHILCVGFGSGLTWGATLFDW